MSLDFTLKKYARLCKGLTGLPCRVMPVNEFLGTDRENEFIIVLRHDVDRCLGGAIRMARVEAHYGIRATYYIRMTRNAFKASGISTISNLGHEIGYHYEVLARTKGDGARAIALFQKELGKIRRIVPVNTASMHGSPLKPWNNLDLWKTYHYTDYGLRGEAYLSIDYTNAYYFTDTGRSWGSKGCNLRDRVQCKEVHYNVRSTDELIGFLRENNDRPVFINAHPNRWAASFSGYLISMMADRSANLIKRSLSIVHDGLGDSYENVRQ